MSVIIAVRPVIVGTEVLVPILLLANVGTATFPVGALTIDAVTDIVSELVPRKVCVNVVEAVDPFEIDDALEVAEMANVSDCVG